MRKGTVGCTEVSVLEVLIKEKKLTKCRYWTKGNTECHHSCVPFRVQGCVVCVHHLCTQEDCRKEVVEHGSTRR